MVIVTVMEALKVVLFLHPAEESPCPVETGYPHHETALEVLYPA